MLAGEVPERSRSANGRSSTTSTSGTARRPACFSISARTARGRGATRMAGCSTASATTAVSRCGSPASATRDDRHRHLRGCRGAGAPERRAQRRGRRGDGVGNVFDELRGLERLGERFDTIVLDPPAFAKSKAAVAKATAGYKEINLRALKLLNPGGILVTCSCSYNVSEAAFAEIVYERGGRRAGARDGRREADAGPRSSGAARCAGDLLPEVLHPAKARLSLRRGGWPDGDRRRRASLCGRSCHLSRGSEFLILDPIRGHVSSATARGIPDSRD